jgi:hypothetical protein
MRRKKNPERTKLGAGMMRHHKGHKSKGQRKAVGVGRMKKERAKLMKQAPKELSPEEQLKWVEAEMRKSFRLKSVRGK